MAITPYLYYQDVDAALKFLAKAFGFEKTGEQMRGPDRKIVHAAMRYGNDMVMMGRPPEYRNPKQLGQSTQSLYINVPDVDKHYARSKKAGATILEEPTNTEYGHRRYGVEDPEGHQWYFAQELRQTRKRASSKSQSKRTTTKKVAAKRKRTA